MKIRLFILGVLGSFTAIAGLLIANGAQASPYGYGSYGSCAYQECSITMETDSTVSLPVTPTDSGVYTIAEDVVEVTTNSSEGYTLQLASASLSENGLVGDDDTIETSSGTTASPVTLASNRWGFRVDGFDGFGMGPTTPVTNQSSSALTFAGIPLSGSPITINTTSEEATSGDSTSVWYGIHVNNSVPAGTYTATVVYTAVMNP